MIGLDQISHAMGQAGVAATTVRNAYMDYRHWSDKMSGLRIDQLLRDIALMRSKTGKPATITAAPRAARIFKTYALRAFAESHS